jgi:hypothetical protein
MHSNKYLLALILFVVKFSLKISFTSPFSVYQDRHTGRPRRLTRLGYDGDTSLKTNGLN